jgi:hypothetical protein
MATQDAFSLSSVVSSLVLGGLKRSLSSQNVNNNVEEQTEASRKSGLCLLAEGFLTCSHISLCSFPFQDQSGMLSESLSLFPPSRFPFLLSHFNTPLGS